MKMEKIIQDLTEKYEKIKLFWIDDSLWDLGWCGIGAKHQLHV